MFAKHFNYVSGTGICTGNIYHRLVHTYIAHYGTSFATYPYFAAVVREASVEAVRIADRYDGYYAVGG